MIEKTKDIIKLLSTKDYNWWKRFIVGNIKNPLTIIELLYYNVKRYLYDVAAKLGFYEYKYNIVFIAGMPMSATTWVKNMFGRVPGYFTRLTPMPFEIAYKQDISESAFKYVPDYGYTLFKTHLNPTESNLNIIKKNGVEKVIVTHRDFRDVVIARYNRLKVIPKNNKQSDSVDVSTIEKEDAINESIEVVAKSYVSWIDGWKDIAEKNNDFIYFCQFENLRSKTKEEFINMLKFYDITLSENIVDEIIESSKGKKNMYKNIQSGATKPGAISSNFRSGKVGGWRDDFTDNNKRYFKELLGHDLIRYGYEKDNNW